MQMRSAMLAATAVALLAACGDDPANNEPDDAGMTDSGVTDTGATDAGADASDTGADASDTGATDAGADASDTDASDAGADASDTGATDTGADTGDAGEDTGDTGADAGTDVGDTSPAPGIEGVWVDGFGGSHYVTAERWQSGWGPTAAHFDILLRDDDARWIVAENGPDNAWNPGLFSRFEWAWDADQLYYCQSVFDAETADAARDAERADEADLEGGCGGFAWSTLTPGQGDLAIAGAWTDGFGNHTIDAAWTQDYGDGMPLIFAITGYDNVDRWLVAQNDSDNAFNPDLFSRFEWAWTPDGDLAYCQSVFDADTADDARDAERADATDLDTGCSGFAWSVLTAVEG